MKAIILVGSFFISSLTMAISCHHSSMIAKKSQQMLQEYNNQVDNLNSVCGTYLGCSNIEEINSEFKAVYSNLNHITDALKDKAGDLYWLAENCGGRDGQVAYDFYGAVAGAYNSYIQPDGVKDHIRDNCLLPIVRKLSSCK
ncbi:hypothetical protein ACRXCV_05200 [Halobacteriovorax sp. GFR7]|uniref:hypothetical protein n=1 Tax=unclassified Halobacteriovorax TaxID=2639665 RepID=UPI003D99082D